MKHKTTYLKAIEHFGEERQVKKAIEELAELLTELAKHQNNKGLRIHLLSEIADASNMIEQLKIIFGEENIQNICDAKIEKLENRMQEELAARGMSSY